MSKFTKESDSVKEREDRVQSMAVKPRLILQEKDESSSEEEEQTR